jgi:8-oxo-dGTP diphosphatase
MDWLARLRQELLGGLRLVQFREPAWDGDADSLRAAFEDTLALCRQQGARCLVNSCHPQSWWPQADGVQLRAADAARILQQDTRPPGWLGVSAHDEQDIADARQLQADFVVLGHVRATDSHPGAEALGWDRFRALATTAGRPVFAIGGQSLDTQETARRSGAHGIAALRGQLIESF